MQIRKEYIHQNCLKKQTGTQLKIEEDYNLSENQRDVEKIILEKGKIRLHEVRAEENRVLLHGFLEFAVLYQGEDGELYPLSGSIGFSDNIRVEGIREGDNIRLKWDVEDLEVGILNSRKLSIRSLVSFVIQVEELCDAALPIRVEEEDTVEILKKKRTFLELCVSEKESCRIREEQLLPSNKPNVASILWKNVQIRGLTERVLEKRIILKGELQTFLLYQGEDDAKFCWLEMSVPFSREIECGESKEDMVPRIEITPILMQADVSPDADGEMRNVEIDVQLELSVQLFREREEEYIEDMYAVDRTLNLEKQNVTLERLLVKNDSRCRTTEKLAMPKTDSRVLQICHSDGTVKIDESRIVDEGIEVEGVIEVSILYITTEDQMPFHSMKGILPFHHMVEAREIDQGCEYYLQTEIEQLTAMLVDSDEIEMKGILSLKALIIQKEEVSLISEASEEELDMEILQEMPGAIGYIVREGDSLWKIAKENFCLRKDIMEMNGLTEEPPVGSKLLVMK